MSEKTQALYATLEKKFDTVPDEKTCDLTKFERNSESQGGNDQVNDIQWDFDKKLHKTEERIYKYKNCIEFVFDADRTHVWQHIMKYLEKPKDQGSLPLLSLQENFNDELFNRITKGSYVISIICKGIPCFNSSKLDKAFVLTDKNTCWTITQEYPRNLGESVSARCEKTSDEVVDRLLAVFKA